MSLHHSNLVEVLDVGEANGRYFLVLELVDGWTLHQIMRRARDAGMPLPPELAVYIVGELCHALVYAHARAEGGEPLNIVHRDVCPNNVLISMHAEVKLTDFGVVPSSCRGRGLCPSLGCFAHGGLHRPRHGPRPPRSTRAPVRALAPVRASSDRRLRRRSLRRRQPDLHQ